MNYLDKVKNKIFNYLSDYKELQISKKEFDPSKLHVKATGFWDDDLKENLFSLSFLRALQKAANKKELQYSFYKPDIEFFSVFSEPTEIDKSKAKIKIFYTGEDVHKNYTRFSDLLLNKTDLSLGFDYAEDMNEYDNYLRFPYWLLIHFGYTEDKDEIKKTVNWFNSRHNCRERFCSYIARHDESGFRKSMIDIVEKVGPVSCGGKSYHNDDSLRDIYKDDKREYNSHFMLNICPESVSQKGYTTEKIFDSFSAGCIPFYYGSMNEPDSFINKNAIIMYNGNNADEVIEKIRLLKDNEKYYKDFIMQPRLLENAVESIFQLNHNLRIKYEELLKKNNLI